ncbi:MAG: octaprenyl diphosphate synthase [Nitrosomonadales bacterium]|nr:octaprenyl diphosphate synthase [Nitrosomonadales bacterium]
MLSTILSPISNDLNEVNNVIRKSLFSEIPIVNQISNHIINSGGKRMRPSIHLLFAKLTGEINTSHHAMAAIIEFIHTATLLHDDVVDQSTQRRSKKTANALFGNSSSVLVGDFIYSRSFQMMTKINNMEVMEILADATNAISEGEILQLLNTKNPDLSENDYFQVIGFKTAKLFESCGSLAGVLNEVDQEKQKDLAKLGNIFGIMFQLTDDILDYSGKEIEMGKNIGDDLTEGKVTLPLIYAMQNGSDNQGKLIKEAIKIGDINRLPDIIQILSDTNAIATVEKHLVQKVIEVNEVLGCFDKGEARKTLSSLANYILERKS